MPWQAFGRTQTHQEGQREEKTGAHKRKSPQKREISLAAGYSQWKRKKSAAKKPDRGRRMEKKCKNLWKFVCPQVMLIDWQLLFDELDKHRHFNIKRKTKYILESNCATPDAVCCRRFCVRKWKIIVIHQYIFWISVFVSVCLSFPLEGKQARIQCALSTETFLFFVVNSNGNTIAFECAKETASKSGKHEWQLCVWFFLSIK